MPNLPWLKTAVAAAAAAAVFFGVTGGSASETPAPAPVAVAPIGQEDPGGQAEAPAPSDPAADHWAVIIGINKYMGSTRNLDGSVGDAKVLYRMLRDHGWKKRNIKLVLNYDATASEITKSLRWLANNTTKRSTVIFHYAGHEMPFYGDVEGDGEHRDVALWATDNRYILDGQLGWLLGKVKAKRMWVHIAACRAGGFDDRGTIKKGRVVTYSSPEGQLSYEDPSRKHSVFGLFVLRKGMKSGEADLNGNGKVSVQSAFRYSENRVRHYTSHRQHPTIVDRMDGAFRLDIPKPKKQQKDEPEPGCLLGICPP